MIQTDRVAHTHNDQTDRAPTTKNIQSDRVVHAKIFGLFMIQTDRDPNRSGKSIPNLNIGRTYLNLIRSGRFVHLNRLSLLSFFISIYRLGVRGKNHELFYAKCHQMCPRSIGHCNLAFHFRDRDILDRFAFPFRVFLHF